MTVMKLVHAEGAVLERLLDDSHGIWADGLSRAAYGRYNLAQLRTGWGQAHLRRVALVEDGQILASAKHYRLTLRVDGTRQISPQP